VSVDRRLARWLDDQADEVELAALAADVERDPALARRAGDEAGFALALAQVLREDARRRAAIAAVVAAARRPAPATRAPALRLLVGAAAVAAAAILVLALVLRSGGPSPTELVVAAGSDGRLERGGDADAARPGSPLRPGDLVVAGTGGVVARAADGTEVRLAAGTRLGVVGAGPRLRLDAGALAVVAARRPVSAPLVVVTPHATATVVGTRLEVVVDDAATRVAVAEGSVRVGDARGASADVEAGSAVVADGASLEPRRSVRVDDFESAVAAEWLAGVRERPPLAAAGEWALRGQPEEHGPDLNVVCLRRTGWLAYADDLGVDVDVLVTGPVPHVGLQVYDPRTGQNYEHAVRDPPAGRWLRLSVRLRDLRPVLRPDPMRPGDALDSLYIVAGERGRQTLYVDRVEIWREAP